MSVVTNVIFAYGVTGTEGDEHALLAEVNRLSWNDARLVHVADPALPWDWFVTGGKTLEVNLAIGAFNHLNFEEWVERLRAIDWERWETNFAQLIVCEQEDNGFRIIDIWPHKSGGVFFN